MRAGPLDRRIVIKAPVTTSDAMGGPVVTYTTLATVWAEKKDTGGREFMAAQQVNAEVTTQFRIRYRSDVTPEHRVTCDGLDYDILYVNELGRRDGLMLMARARAESVE